MKFTLKQLRTAGNEINELFGNEAIDLTLDENETTLKIIEALDLIDMEADRKEFTEKTYSVLEEIQQSTKKPKAKVPKPKKVNIDTTEEEDEEEISKEEEEEAEEDANVPVEIEEPEIIPLDKQINDAKKLATLHAIMDANPVFKKLAKVKDKFKTLVVLKKAMLDVLEEAEPAPASKKEKDKVKNEAKKEIEKSTKATKKVEVEKETAKEDKPLDKKSASKEKAEIKKETKDLVKKEKVVKSGKRTKKAVIIEMLASEEGATIEEMAQKMVDEGIDEDYQKNCAVTRLWLNKMGVNCKKATLAKNPRLKAIIK